jgi:HAD superfamily hydrolase (TIGR01509 family)
MLAVLWDLDGTLIDTTALHYHAWQQTMSDFGEAYSYEEFAEGFGRSNRSVLAEKFQIAPDAPRIHEISTYKEAMVRQLLPTTELTLMPGVAAALELLAAHGVLQAISSSGPMANIVAMVNKLAIGDRFAAILSGANLARGKPHPGLFLNSAAALGVAPALCIVVEDSVHGIEGARCAGMASVAVGALANSTLLAERLIAVSGPPCLSAPSLADTEWATWEGLWQQLAIVNPSTNLSTNAPVHA